MAGSTTHPDTTFVKQCAPDLTAYPYSFLRDAKKLMMDRGANFTDRFRDILQDAGCSPVRFPARPPHLYSHDEPFVKSIKIEYLDRIILFGQRHLEHAIRESVAHYNPERSHQGLENELLSDGVMPTAGRLRRRERLGGLLSSYNRAS